MWWYFRPKTPELQNPIFVEADSKTEANDILELKSYILFEFYDPQSFTDLISATSWERGCETNWLNGVFSYREKQGIANPNSYLSFDDWKKFSYKMTIIRAQEKKLVPKIDPLNDGCACRVCKNWYYMAEPDHKINDGKLTCYSCKDRYLRLKMQ